MKIYKIDISCESKEAIKAIKQYALNNFEGVTTIEWNVEDTLHIGSRSHTVLRTTRKA